MIRLVINRIMKCNYSGYLVSFLLFCISLSGCGDYSLRKDMKEFMKREIEFPAELLKYTGGLVSDGTITFDRPTLVLLYGKDMCAGCAISQLFDCSTGLKHIEQSEKCEVVILFSPAEDNVLEVQDELRKAKLPLTIYVDQYGDFYRLNKNFPSSTIFHSFLLDTDKHPIFIGNPLDNEALMNVFKRALENTWRIPKE